MNYLILLSSIFLALLLVLKLAGLRINTSNSIPIGLYWAVNKPIEKGEYVIFCPKKSLPFVKAMHYGILTKGFCPEGSGALMKYVAGISGDRITINGEGVFVNGNKLPLSKPILVDGLNHPLPQIQITNHMLTANELLLMTNQNRFSFDARYFGLTDVAEVQSVIKPLITKSILSN